MQNKVLRQRENQGWEQLRKQLDVDLPLAKRKDRKVLWFFLLAVLGLGGILWLSSDKQIQSIIPEEKQLEIQKYQDKTKIQNPTASQTPAENKAAPALTIPESEKNQSPENAAKTLPSTDLNKKKSDHTVLSKSSSPHPSIKNITNNNNDHKTESITDVKSTLPDSKDETAINRSAIDATKINATKAFEAMEPQTDIKQTLDEKLIEPKNTAVVPAQEIPDLSQTSPDKTSINKIETTGEPKPEDPLSLASNLESPIVVPPVPIKVRRHNLNLAMDYSSDNFFSSYLMAGKDWPIAGKFYLSSQAGLGFQFNKSNYKVVGFNSQSPANPGSLNDVKNSTVFSSVNAGKILLDQTRLISGFRGDTLVLSASDQIFYHSRNQWMAAVQAGFGYKINSFWSIESGIRFRSYLTSSRELLQVDYALGTNNGFKPIGSSVYQLKASTLRSQWSWYINSGFQLAQQWGLNFQFNTLPIIIRTRKSDALEAHQGIGSTNNSPAKILSLPVKQDASALRMSIQYRF